MTVSLVLDQTVRTAGFRSGCKDAALWLGRSVKLGWTKASPVLLPLFRQSALFLRTGFGFGAVGIILGSSCLIAAFTNKKCSTSIPARISLIVLGTALIAGSIALTILIGPAAIV